MFEKIVYVVLKNLFSLYGARTSKLPYECSTENFIPYLALPLVWTLNGVNCKGKRSLCPSLILFSGLGAFIENISSLGATDRRISFWDAPQGIF